jgi:cyanophycinase
VSVSSSQFRTAILIWVFAASLLQAQESDSTGSATQESAAPIRTDELFPYTGGLVIVGGGGTPDAVRQAFVDLAGGTEGRLVVIPTASEYAERPDAETYYLEDWQPAGFTSLRLLHAPDRETSASAPFLAALREATAVWFSGGDQAVLAERFLDTPVEAELQALLERGGAIGGTSAGAAIQTRVMIASGRDEPEMARGFDLLPRGIADQHFLARERQPRLRIAVRKNPACVGWGIDERTALIVRREGLAVLGESSVTQIFVDPESSALVEHTHASGTALDWSEAVPAAVRAAQDSSPPLSLNCRGKTGTVEGEERGFCPGSRGGGQTHAPPTGGRWGRA